MIATKTLAPWQLIKRQLEDQGWEVEYEQVWLARARRGINVEDGVAPLLDDAFAQLQQQTRLDNCEGCP